VVRLGEFQVVDFFKVGLEVGFFLGSGVESQGVVGAVEDAVGADGLEDLVEDGGVVEEGGGCGVVVDVLEFSPDGGVEFVKGQESSPVGVDEFGVRVLFGQPDVVLKWGFDFCGVGAANGFGDVEVDGEFGVTGGFHDVLPAGIA